jgi:phage terminase large subunit-like protein
LPVLPSNNSRADRVIAFITKHCRAPEGKDVGKPLVLAEFQKNFIRAIYDNPAGTRRAYLSIGRKNGKSGLIACLLLAHLVGPEAVENSQIVSGALSRDQASLVFELARKMVMHSPDLQKLVRVVPSGKRLIGLPMNVEYRALAAEGTTAHGLSPVLAILDEVGQIRGPKSDFVEAIVTSQGAYENPLLIAISTQAATDADLFSLWLDDAKQSNDPAIVSHVYSAPADCELDDREAWAAANPALGIFRSLKDVEAQAAEAARMPTSETSFRWLILNQRIQPFSPFVSPGVWRENEADAADEAFRYGEVYGGLDLSETTDLTAFVLVAVYQGEYHVRCYFWMAGDLVPDRARMDRRPYDVWAKQGLLLTTPGKSIEYAYVAAEIARLCEGLKLKAISCDPYRMKLLLPHFELSGISLPFETVPQRASEMSPRIDALETALLHAKVRHGGHPVLAMCAANAVAVRDSNGNRKLDKAKSSGRIDGMVALAMAVGTAEMALQEPAKPTAGVMFL